MENKSLKWFIGGIILVMIGLVIITIIDKTKKEEYFKVVDIPSNHLIDNRTDKKYLDTILSTGLSIIKITPNIVRIEQLKEKVSFQTDDGEIVLEAYIQGSISPFGNQYIIYIAELSKEEYIRVLSHELVHLLQYDTGRLQIYDDFILWKGHRYYNDEIPDYRYREWEIEARGATPLLEAAIKNILIPKEDVIQ